MSTLHTIAAPPGVDEAVQPWAHWKLDGDWQDSSGNGRHLTPPTAAGGVPAFFADPPAAGTSGARFDSVNVNVSTQVPPWVPPWFSPSVADLQALVSGPQTWAAWVRPDALPASNSITNPVQELLSWTVASASTHTVLGGLRWTRRATSTATSTQPIFLTQSPTGGSSVLGIGSFWQRVTDPMLWTPRRSEWHHVAVTLVPSGNLQGSVQLCDTRWWLNGAPARLAPGTTAESSVGTVCGVPVFATFSPALVSARISLGARWSQSAGAFVGPFDGCLDDVRIYARALTERQIRSLANGPSARQRLALVGQAAP